MKEEWKEIPGFDGYYLASNIGRIFSVRSEKIMKQRNSLGYMRVNISINGRRESWTVHLLVALTFIPNPECKPTVNHINEIKNDNRVENLEWATVKEQNIHGTRIERARKHTNYKSRQIDYASVASKHDYIRIGELCAKAVSQYRKTGEFVRTYKSLKEASNETGVGISNISSCINGHRKTAGGWLWKLAI